MNTKRINFPSILLDNDMAYLSYVIRCLDIIDPDASLIISKGAGDWGFTLRPSNDKLKDILVENIKSLHQNLGLIIEFSSFHASSAVTFRLLAT